MRCYETTYSDLLLNHLIEFNSYRPLLFFCLTFLFEIHRNSSASSYEVVQNVLILSLPLISFYIIKHPCSKKNNILIFPSCLFAHKRF